METIDGIAFFAIVETSIVPVEVELEDVAAAFKRLLLEVVCCAVVVVAVAVVLPAKVVDCLEGTAGNTAEQNCA